MLMSSKLWIRWTTFCLSLCFSYRSSNLLNPIKWTLSSPRVVYLTSNLKNENEQSCIYSGNSITVRHETSKLTDNNEIDGQSRIQYTLSFFPKNSHLQLNQLSNHVNHTKNQCYHYEKQLKKVETRYNRMCFLIM